MSCGWCRSLTLPRGAMSWSVVPSKHAYMGPIWGTHMGPLWGTHMGPLWGVQPGSAWDPYGLAHMRVAQMGPIWVPYNSPIKKKKEMIETYFLVYNAWLASTVADTEGIHVGRLNPHLRQSYSIFMRNFKQNQHKLSNNHVQFSNRNLLCKFEPPSKKS